MAETTNWIADAETALDGKPVEGVELLAGQRPPVLDRAGIRAAVAPFLAAFMWSAVVFRENMVSQPLDGLALILRLLALALSVRAAMALATLWSRVRGMAESPRHKLALTDGGLLYRTPDADFALAREDIIGIRERGDWGKRSGRRWGDVYVITRPDSGRTHIALPPYFERTPGILAERLMRWRGVVDAPETVEYPERVQLASKLFDDVAAGARPAGVSIILHGRGWLRRAPYATVLLGVAVLDGFVRMPAAQRDAVGLGAPLVVVFALVIVPFFWLMLVQHDIRPRKGVALVLTPSEMLMRTRSGVHRVSWASLSRLEITSRTVWSILQGAHEARSLVIHRKDEADNDITYVEAFLGAPAEVVVGLCDAYRKGIIGA